MVYRCDISDTAISTVLTFSDNVQPSSPNMLRIQQPYQQIQRQGVAVAGTEAADVDAVAVAEAVKTTLM